MITTHQTPTVAAAMTSVESSARVRQRRIGSRDHTGAAHAAPIRLTNPFSDSDVSAFKVGGSHEDPQSRRTEREG